MHPVASGWPAIWRGLAWLLLTALAATAATASETGRSGFSGDPGTSGGAVCSVCHAPDGAPAPVVRITGPSVVDAGTVQDYLVTVSGGPAVTAGVGLAVGGAVGSLQAVGADLRLLDGELTHSAPKPFAAGDASFSFRYRAPDHDAEVVLYAAGNATDGARDLRGDGVGATSFAVSVRNGFVDPPPPPPPPGGELEARVFATGLSRPVAIAHAGDARLFVVEQAGVIRIVAPDGSVLPTPFLDIRSRVDDRGSEMGLLGLAFHPDYATNGQLFVNYTVDPGPGPGLDRTRVSRFTVSADPDVADPASEQVLLEFEQPFSNHNGGDLHFGPDGFLHIASGDGGSAGDPQDNAQNTRRLLGKMLRIDVDGVPGPGDGPDCDVSGSAHYRIPPGNAFTDGPGGAGCDEIYMIGLRNPWRFSFDRETGAMWIGDVGQNRFEEINHIPPGAGGGLNLGWRCFEGLAPFNPAGCTLDYLFPVHQYAHTTGGCSVTGGVVYRGALFPVLAGQYFFSDFCQPSIRALAGPPGDPTVREVLPAGVIAAPSAFGEDVAGELYVADLATGTLFRLGAVLAAGDVDGDGDVDRDDVVAIWRARGSPAAGPDDRRDLDDDGLITFRDVRLAVAACDRPRCATE